MNGSADRFDAPGVPPRIGKAVAADRWRWLAAVLAGALTVVLVALDPGRERLVPACLFHAITGLNCPGCGGTRALQHLLHGELAAALRCNALLVLALPLGLGTALGYALGLRLPRDTATRWCTRAAWLALGVAIGFAIVRNLPLGACLSP